MVRDDHMKLLIEIKKLCEYHDFILVGNFEIKKLYWSDEVVIKLHKDGSYDFEARDDLGE